MKIPHLIPYQGSKRKLALPILNNINFRNIEKFYEPFAGSSAITLAAATHSFASDYIIADKFIPLANIWKLVFENPEELQRIYSQHWHNQQGNEKEYFLKVRNHFNQTQSPGELLYLIVRSVKNAIRFNAIGGYNQSPDNRRKGTHPEKIAQEIKKIHALLKDHITVKGVDFIEALSDATEHDVVYMDPPWQGTSNNNDTRYAHLLEIDVLIREMERLNDFKVPFLLSFDGSCGDKNYGQELPKTLCLKKIDLHAGWSSQATLLGRKEETIESLYLSPTLIEKNKKVKIKQYLQLI